MYFCARLIASLWCTRRCNRIEPKPGQASSRIWALCFSKSLTNLCGNLYASNLLITVNFIGGCVSGWPCAVDQSVTEKLFSNAVLSLPTFPVGGVTVAAVFLKKSQHYKALLINHVLRSLKVLTTTDENKIQGSFQYFNHITSLYN